MMNGRADEIGKEQVRAVLGPNPHSFVEARPRIENDQAVRRRTQDRFSAAGAFSSRRDKVPVRVESATARARRK